MSASFTAAASRLAGVIPRLLGWSPHAFWEATPAEIVAILRPDGPGSEAPLTRSELAALVERDRDG